MKRIFQLLFFSVLLLAIDSCKKDENKIFLEESTALVLTASSTSAMVLTNADKDQTALTLNWTNPDYRFTTGVSSQNVTYTLQFDTAGSNFTRNPNIQEMAIANEVSKTLLVKELNGFLSKMELSAGKPYDMEVRVKAAIGSSAVLYSNILKLRTTPYLDFAAEPPGTAANNYDDGQLWVTGDCFLSDDWANPLNAPYDVKLKFTKIDKLHYELIADFDKGGGYKMIQEPGVWATQYHAVKANEALSGDFKKEDADPQFASPGAGKYKIEVNFQTGKYKLTPQ